MHQLSLTRDNEEGALIHSGRTRLGCLVLSSVRASLPPPTNHIQRRPPHQHVHNIKGHTQTYTHTQSRARPASSRRRCGRPRRARRRRRGTARRCVGGVKGGAGGGGVGMWVGFDNWLIDCTGPLTHLPAPFHTNHRPAKTSAGWRWRWTASFTSSSTGQKAVKCLFACPPTHPHLSPFPSHLPTPPTNPTSPPNPNSDDALAVLQQALASHGLDKQPTVSAQLALLQRCRELHARQQQHQHQQAAAGGGFGACLRAYLRAHAYI